MARRADYQEVINGRLVRAWRRRGYIEVLVWPKETDGEEPVGEWEMPNIFRDNLPAISRQAEAQTKR